MIKQRKQQRPLFKDFLEKTLGETAIAWTLTDHYDSQARLLAGKGQKVRAVDKAKSAQKYLERDLKHKPAENWSINLPRGRNLKELISLCRVYYGTHGYSEVLEQHPRVDDYFFRFESPEETLEIQLSQKYTRTSTYKGKRIHFVSVRREKTKVRSA